MNSLMPQKSSSKINIFYYIKLSIYTFFILALSIQIVNSFQDKKQKLDSYEAKILDGSTLNSFELKEFCQLFLEIKKVSIPDCENLKSESLKTLLGLDKSILKLLGRFCDKYTPFIKIENQLQGKGQIRNLRNSPNLEEIDSSEILSRTPLELVDLFKEKLNNREISIEEVNSIIRQINKCMENRNLNRVNRK